VPATSDMTPRSSLGDRLRLRADEVYTLPELREAVQKHRRDGITQAADFTLRDHRYLMRPQENWSKLAWNLDRKYFIDCLDKVVEIRNDPMHSPPTTLTRLSMTPSRVSSKCSGRPIPDNDLARRESRP